MAAVMIGVDPHKASHTAVAISASEEPLSELRVRASAVQVERLLVWAAADLGDRGRRHTPVKGIKGTIVERWDASNGSDALVAGPGTV